MELLQLQWRWGDPLDVYVLKPKGVKKPPVILNLYGFPTDTDPYKNEIFKMALTKDGFAAVGFVCALTGHRYHDRPMREWFLSDLQESLGTTAHDVQMILDYLAARGDLDMNRVGMFGQGTGATIAILASAVDPRIKVLDVLDPWGDWPNWIANFSRCAGGRTGGLPETGILRESGDAGDARLAAEDSGEEISHAAEYVRDRHTHGDQSKVTCGGSTGHSFRFL